MRILKKCDCLAIISFIVFFLCSIAYGDESQVSPVGGGIGLILSGEKISEKDLGMKSEGMPEQSSSTAAQSITGASQLVGLYVLHDFTVRYDSGQVMYGSNYSYTGDMAITINNNMWQKINISGIQPIIASASFSLSGNTLTLYNDLAAGTSIATLTWDGTYLTTQTYISGVADPYTEIDVWKRVLSQPSDQDSDGVIDTWDKCPGTTSSCVDKSGCGCARFKPAFNPATSTLLLEDE
jgi:hypothetical protein